MTLVDKFFICRSPKRIDDAEERDISITRVLKVLSYIGWNIHYGAGTHLKTLLIHMHYANPLKEIVDFGSPR
jgi:hypothetical protein